MPGSPPGPELPVTGGSVMVPSRLGPDRIRDAFPMLARTVRGSRLAYLDSAATALKPEAMIVAMDEYFRRVSANVARGVHTPSQEATDRFEAVRAKAAAFLGAAPGEIVFTAGTTASLNLVAQTWGRTHLRAGDEVLVSELEHHSNLVPWQMVAEAAGARVRAIPIDDRGDLDLGWLGREASDRTRVVAICHVSNVLGTVNPVAEVARLAHQVGAVCVVDGAQGAPHLPVDVARLGCDFYALSAHKLFGPTGLGVLFGRRELLEAMPPWQGGGGMIGSVTIERSTFAPPPARFEAGTPPVAEVYGLGAVLDVLGTWDWEQVAAHEAALVVLARRELQSIGGVTVYGDPIRHAGVVTFGVEGVHPHDVGTALDAGGVCVRAGHHCAQPLMTRLGVVATVRASFAPYSTQDDVLALAAGVRRAQEVFGA